jgi:hypothetical protein
MEGRGCSQNLQPARAPCASGPDGREQAAAFRRPQFATMASPPPPGRQLTRQMTSRHAKVDEHGAEKVEPGCFTTAVGKRPCCACWLSFFIALFVGGIGAGSGRVRVEASGVASLDSDRVPEMVNFFSWLRGVDRPQQVLWGQRHRNQPGRASQLALHL